MTTWTDESKTAVLLKKKDGTEVVFKQGDFISYEGREHGVKVVDIRFVSTEPGPRGFEYLPWRHDEQRWATPIFAGLGRQPRFVICYPSGTSSWGQHINWDSFNLLNDGKCPEELSAKI